MFLKFFDAVYKCEFRLCGFRYLNDIAIRFFQVPQL
mgnify:CR=1 FL=1